MHLCFCCLDDLCVEDCDGDGSVMPRELEQYAEFDSENSMDRISVQGRLRAHSQFWLEELLLLLRRL